MHDGKLGENFYICWEDFGKSLRELGARGIAIQHHCFDKLMYSKIMRLIRGRYAEKFSLAIAFAEEMSHEQIVQYVLEWVTGIPCSQHGASNAVKWGLMHVGDAEIRDNAHISIKALINTSTDIHANVESFAMPHVAFVERIDREEDVRAFWQFLMVAPVLLEKYVTYDPPRR